MKHILKNVLPMAAIALCTGVANAQERATISGYINDSQSKETILGATILHTGTMHGTITNEFGFRSPATSNCCPTSTAAPATSSFPRASVRRAACLRTTFPNLAASLTTFCIILPTRTAVTKGFFTNVSERKKKYAKLTCKIPKNTLTLPLNFIKCNNYDGKLYQV